MLLKIKGTSASLPSGHAAQVDKDIVSWNLIIRQALKKLGVYYYIFPTYSQAKKVIWDSITNDGMRFRDFIPPSLVKSSNSQEMKIFLTNGSLIQLIGSDHIDCYDEKTEILTENGWKFFKDLDKTETVATLKNGFLVYDKPSHYIEKEYSGVMYSGNNNSIDFLVTPRHRFFVKSGKGFYKFKKITEISLSGDSVPSTCKWVGEETETFTFPETINSWTCGKGRKVIDKRSRSLPMEKFVALLGIYLSEGSTYKDDRNYRVIISQTKANIREKIRSLLDSSNINYCIDKKGFNILDKQMYLYFSRLNKQKDRFIPKDIKNLSPKYLSILLEWLVYGDGSVQGKQIKYYSSSKKLIDDVQEIVIKLGFSGNISVKAKKGTKCYFKRDSRYIEYKSDLYQLLIRRSKFKRFASSKKKYITTQEYSGKIYCVTVPSGVIKVRRNGKEIWSGNSVVGTNPIGCVFSEYALQSPDAYKFLRPILVANNGWALFESTPRGRINHLYELYQIALNSPEWFCYKLTLDDTQHISRHTIEKEKAEGLMSEDLIMQEYYTSFDLGIEGSYYSRYIDKMRLNGQITNVPWEPSFKVHTAWDLGMRDATSIIFFQTVGTTVRIIDCYENTSQGLEHYAKYLSSLPYDYGKHFAPHDIAVRELGTGVSRLEKSRQLGLHFKIAPKLSIEDGIEACRSTFAKVWLDEDKGQPLLKALESYRQEYDSKRGCYTGRVLHDLSSNFSDAYRYMCISLPKCRDGLSSEDIDRNYREAKYGNQSNLPDFFRDDYPKY